MITEFEVLGKGEANRFGEAESLQLDRTGPRFLDVLVGAVGYFSVRVGLVAVVSKMAGKREHVGVEISEFDVVVGDAVGVGAGAGEEGGAGGVADGLLAIGALKEAGLRGELIDVGSDGEL